MAKVTIVMSVFNGSNYLQQQLSSLEIQSCSEWKLLVRDNASTDNTYSILESFQEKLGRERVEIVREAIKIDEVYNSFMSLVDLVETDYCMFCDGDDFWLPEKVGRAIDALQNMEAAYGKGIPLLYHTDLILTDDELTPKFLSMWTVQALNPKRNSPIQCIMHSSACGNTFVFNRALMLLIKNRPTDIIMHDIYCATIASLFGKISYSRESQILYRQHSSNLCGGGKILDFNTIRKKLNPSKIKAAVDRKSGLAFELLELFSDQMTQNDLKNFRAIAKVRGSSWIYRRFLFIKSGAYLNGFVRNVGLFIFG